jgi:phosphatidylglycerophosphate synthase
MPFDTSLLVLPGAAVPGTTPLLGLPIERRIALAARRAGFAESVEDAPARLVFLPAEVVPQVSYLKTLRALTLAPERLHRAGSALLLDTEEPRSARGLGPEALAARFGPPVEVPEPAGSFVLRSPADLPAAERWLLASLVKDEEGFMSRHVERKISLAITRCLASTGITPNAMTLVSVGLGLAGSAFFLSERPASELTGALLFLLHSILDGCDGELARLKFLESRWGGVLDFWGDNVVHVAVFLAIAIGWSRTIGSSWPLLLGVSAAAGTILSALFVYLTTMTGKKDGPLFTSVSSAPATPVSRLTALMDALARRDFIYLVVLLSAFGKARWFLALAAVGSPAFFAALLVVAGMHRAQRG